MRFNLRFLPGRTSRKAFSLTELLAVVSIVLTLGALSVSALAGSRKGASMNIGVIRVINALNQARSEAISRNTGVQLRLVSRDGTDAASAGRSFSLWARKKGAMSEYEQITPWERLPDSVSVQEDAAWFPAAGNDNLKGDNVFGGGATPANLLAGVPYYRRTVDTLVVEFSPSGGVRLPRPGQAYSYILLAPTVPEPAGSGDLSARALEVRQFADWRQIRICNLTGQMKINSPGA